MLFGILLLGAIVAIIKVVLIAVAVVAVLALCVRLVEAMRRPVTPPPPKTRRQEDELHQAYLRGKWSMPEHTAPSSGPKPQAHYSNRR